jgi:hypothetical protein
MGPELLRVKDLARNSNSFDGGDYAMAFKLLLRISKRKASGIIISRGAAGKALVPSSVRLSFGPIPVADEAAILDATGTLIGDTDNELVYKSLLNARALPDGITDYLTTDPDGSDLLRVELPINPRYDLLAYGDASFAVGEFKQSVSGYVVYLNGVPLLWLFKTDHSRRLVLFGGVCCCQHCMQATASRRKYGCFPWLQLPEAVSPLYRFSRLPLYRHQSVQTWECSPLADSVSASSVLRVHRGCGHSGLRDRGDGR